MTELELVMTIIKYEDGRQRQLRMSPDKTYYEVIWDEEKEKIMRKKQLNHLEENMKLKELKEGSTDYYTLVEIENKEIIIREPVTGDDFDFRSHEVETTKGGKAEYFDIAIEADRKVKDIGLTYTGLSQLGKALADKPWVDARLLYEGTKGTGKNIKYLWTFKGQAAPAVPLQQALGNQPPVAQSVAQADPRQAALLKAITDFPNTDVETLAQMIYGDKGLAEFALRLLKAAGRITEKEGRWVVT